VIVGVRAVVALGLNVPEIPQELPIGMKEEIRLVPGLAAGRQISPD
jgi:hypothetical protein